jgi:hypothetical protein
MLEKKKIVKEKETKIDKNIKKYVPFAIWLGVLAVVFVVFYLLFQGLGKVGYEGLTFTREKYGEVIVYHYYYLTEIADGKIRKIDVLLRGNPAENKVPVEGNITYPEGRTVYLSINNSGLNECTYSMVALSSFSIFMANNDIALKAGTPDKDEAQKNNLTYATCGKYPGNMVISLKSGNESKIERTTGYCYNLEVTNCEILPVIEKFIVQSILDAKESA